MHRAFRVSAGLLVGLSLLALLPGCSQGSFLGNRFNNFRAYYNTFYNARKAFYAGEEALEQAERQIDRSRFLPVFPATQSGTTTAGGQFDDAIEKSADLLRERSDSKWADDALLLIGKAYFYQNNVVGAEGKFRETIGAALELEQFELVDEARFWLGRTLGSAERFEEAASVLEEGLARPDIRPRWRSRMLLALGELYVQERRWDDAADVLRRGIPDTGENSLAARAQFLLGQVLEANGNYSDAADAFAAVANLRPLYELSYAAKLSEALVLGTAAGDSERALELIRRMRRDDKNFQNRAEVELAYARLLAVSDRAEEAEQRFRALLYDEEYRSNNVRGEVYYRYAEFFRDEANDYVRAAAYFDTAATNMRVEPGREELVTRVALKEVRRSAEIYRSYATIASKLTEADSLLRLGSLEPDEFSAAISAIEQERLRRWNAEQTLLAARRADQGFGGTPVGGRGDFPLEDDPGRAAVGGGGLPVAEAGFLNYRDPARRQDAMLAFERVWGDRPFGLNWRRLAALRSTVVEQRGPQAEDPDGVSATRSGGPPALDISKVPRTQAARERVLAERAELRYELGNVFFLSLALPDSAAHWYGLAIGEDADQPVVVRARYALAEVLRAQGNNSEAEELYKAVIGEDPGSPQAAQARERLGLPPLEPDDSASLRALADEEYARAYGLWQGDSFRLALGQLLRLGSDFSDSYIAARALLAAGLVFTEWSARDGFSPELGIPGELVPPVLFAELDRIGGAGPERDAAGPPDEQPVIDSEAEEEEGPPEKSELLGIDGSQGIATDDGPSGEPDVPDADVDSLESFARGRDPEAELSPIESSAHSPTRSDSTTNSEGPFDEPAESLTPARTLGLADLYRLIESLFPDSEFAANARSQRAVFETLMAPTTGLPGGDPNPADPEGDPTAPLAQDVVDSAPEGTFGLSGELPLDAAIGGFSWKVASLPSPLAAAAMLRNFAERGLRAGVVEESFDRRQLYLLFLGQFPSIDEAEASRDDLPETGIGRELEIVPIFGLGFLSLAYLDQFRPD